MTNEPLPRRVVKIKFPQAPATLEYESRPDVIVRLAEALRVWNPDVHIEVLTVVDQAKDYPELPCWRLYAWDL